MRFAYIDSQGKEVGIPSVEALGLRIELGAITPSTQLYDSTADRWAPASEHEVFRTLSREIQEKGEGFVAPPPQSRPPAPQPESAGPKTDEAADEAPPSEPAKPPAPSSDAAAPAPSAPPPSESPERRRAPNPFEMLDGQAEEAPEPPAVADAGEADDADDEADPLDMGFDLTLTPPDEEDVSEPPEAEPAQAHGAEEPGGGFDMGGMEALEVEGSSVVEDDDATTVVSDGGLELEDTLSASYGDVDADAPPGPGQGRGAVSLWDDEGGADDEDDASSWAMEAPAEAGDEPEEQAEARRRADVERRRASARARFADDDEGETGGVAPQVGEKRPARSAPSSRPRSKAASSGVPAGAVWGILLLVVAGAGWFGWSLFQDRRAAAVAAAADDEPPVPIPQIPADLEPRYRELADAALEATLAELRALPERQALAPSPPERWLSGEYMANASGFSQLEAYLDGLREYLDAVRAADSLTFAAAFAAALEGPGADEAPEDEEEGDAGGARAAPDEGEAELLRRRAAAGFSATGRDRRRAYADFENVLSAAGSLHAFLLENEDQIEYAPAAGGMSVDPVLEAVPASPALGDEMWARVDDITEALDALGALDQVTTDRLVAVLLGRVEAAGVR